MHRSRLGYWVLGVAFAPLMAAAAAEGRPLHTYRGLCDASAAVELGRDSFVVAGDEDNVLRAYRIGEEQPLARSRDLSSLLEAEIDHGEFREADIEGVARIGELVFWIGSHSQSRKGAARSTRNVLFATRIALRDGKTLEVELESRPYRKLVDDLLELPALAPFELDEARRRSPKRPGGLNIEGLAATPEGALWIGFRSPLSATGGALVVPLLNPLQVIRGKRPTFGEPMTLALGERGIRSLDYLQSRRAYSIVAGPSRGDGPFALYQWAGRSDQAPERCAPEHPLPEGFAAEALVGGLRWSTPYVLSDDGAIRGADGVECKRLPEAQQTFRGVAVPPCS